MGTNDRVIRVRLNSYECTKLCISAISVLEDGAKSFVIKQCENESAFIVTNVKFIDDFLSEDIQLDFIEYDLIHRDDGDTSALYVSHMTTQEGKSTVLRAQEKERKGSAYRFIRENESRGYNSQEMIDQCNEDFYGGMGDDELDAFNCNTD